MGACPKNFALKSWFHKKQSGNLEMLQQSWEPTPWTPALGLWTSEPGRALGRCRKPLSAGHADLDLRQRWAHLNRILHFEKVSSQKRWENVHKSYNGIKARKCLFLWFLLREKVLAYMELYLINETFPVAEPWLFCNKLVCPRTVQWPYWDPKKPEMSEKTLAIHQRITESMKFWDDILHTIWYFSVLSQGKKNKNPISFSFQWGERRFLNHKAFPLS